MSKFLPVLEDEQVEMVYQLHKLYFFIKCLNGVDLKIVCIFYLYELNKAFS